jgi:hypothetical protein
VHSKASIHSLEEILLGSFIIWMNASKIPLKHIPRTKLLKLFVSYNLQFNEGNKGCVTLWPLPFTLRSNLKSQKGIMEIQIFHHAKI